MKKILVLLLMFSVNCSAFGASYIDKQLKEAKKNTRYNTVKKYERNFSTLDNYSVTLNTKKIKDPKLIKLSDFTPVDETAYKQKLAKDELLYKNEVLPVLKKKPNSLNDEPEAVDFYKVYRVCERLIRANNLGYANWRIAIRKTPDEVNAASLSGNFIYINTALYDSLYNNEDALAFVMAHEMSHLILGHSQRSAELYTRLNNFMISREINNKRNNDAIASLAYSTTAMYQLKKTYNELKMMEFLADSEGFNLLIRAGYSPSKAIEALNFLDVMPNIRFFIEDHPIAQERIKSAYENIAVANPDWAEEGKTNIYNSEVLTCKKSSDRVSIVINKDEKLKKYYEPEDITTKLTRIAYVSYTKGNFEKSAKYFKKLTDISESYVPYLYLSYCQEQLFNQTKDKKYLKQAQQSIEKATEMNSTDNNVKQQLQDLNSL